MKTKILADFQICIILPLRLFYFRVTMYAKLKTCIMNPKKR